MTDLWCEEEHFLNNQFDFQELYRDVKLPNFLSEFLQFPVIAPTYLFPSGCTGLISTILLDPLFLLPLTSSRLGSILFVFTAVCCSVLVLLDDRSS